MLQATSLQKLALRELEALSRALLSVFLALFASRIATDKAFRLQFLAQLCIELHQRAGDAQLHGIRLTAHAAAQNAGDHVERCTRFRRCQRSLRRRALCRGHEIFVKGTPVHLEIAGARTQVNPGNRRLTASRPVVLNQLCCHLAFSSLLLASSSNQKRAFNFKLRNYPKLCHPERSPFSGGAKDLPLIDSRLRNRYLPRFVLA